MGVMCTNWSELAPSPQISTNPPQQPTSFPLRICCNLSLFCLFFTLLSACLLELHCPSGQPLATDGGLNLNSLNCIKLKVQFTLKVLNSHIWLFATILYTNDLENFHYCRKFYWTALNATRLAIFTTGFRPFKHLSTGSPHSAWVWYTWISINTV